MRKSLLKLYNDKRQHPPVERIIGFKRSTDGTGGVSYFQIKLRVWCFSELWSLREKLINEGI